MVEYCDKFKLVKEFFSLESSMIPISIQLIPSPSKNMISSQIKKAFKRRDSDLPAIFIQLSFSIDTTQPQQCKAITPLISYTHFFCPPKKLPFLITLNCWQYFHMKRVKVEVTIMTSGCDTPRKNVRKHTQVFSVVMSWACYTTKMF